MAELFYVAKMYIFVQPQLSTQNIKLIYRIPMHENKNDK